MSSIVTSCTALACPNERWRLAACGEAVAARRHRLDVEAAAGQKPPEELGADLAGQAHPVLAGEVPILRQHNRRWAVGRWREVDRRAVYGHSRLLVLHQRFPAVTSA